MIDTTTSSNRKAFEFGILKKARQVYRPIKENLQREFASLIQISGNVLQTPGPGGIQRNIDVFHEVVGDEGEQIFCERNQNLYSKMMPELSSSRKIHRVRLVNKDLFQTAFSQPKESLVLLDACLTRSLYFLIEEGLADDLIQLFSSKVMASKSYFSLTYSLRTGNKEEDRDYIKTFMAKFPISLLREESYREMLPDGRLLGGNMQSYLWELRL